MFSPSVGLIGAFLFGLLGSVSHCVAMCGGIALAVSAETNDLNARLRVIGYHVGRLATYTAIGAAVGLTGSLVNFAGEASASIRWGAALFAGVVMIVAGGSLIGAGRFVPDNWMPAQWITRRAGPLMRRTGLDAGLALGLLLGFLPCGLVYTAASYALAAADPARGAAVMLAFGLGTVPALALTGWIGARLRIYSLYFRRVAGALLILSGIYFIAAGFPG